MEDDKNLDSEKNKIPPISTVEAEAHVAPKPPGQPTPSQALEFTSPAIVEQESNRDNSITQSHIPAAKKSTRKTIIKIVLIIVLCVPVIGIGLFALGIGGLGFACNQKVTNLEKYASDVGNRLDSMAIDMSEKSYGADGDCLTGSGAYFNFTVNKSYPSPMDAKKDIVTQASKVGLAAPQPTQEPQYLFARDDNFSGGNTSISKIEATYYLENKDSYEFLFELQEPIACEVSSYNQVICAGKPQDTLLQELLKTSPVKKITVRGSISSD